MKIKFEDFEIREKRIADELEYKNSKIIKITKKTKPFGLKVK